MKDITTAKAVAALSTCLCWPPEPYFPQGGNEGGQMIPAHTGSSMVDEEPWA